MGFCVFVLPIIGVIQCAKMQFQAKIRKFYIKIAAKYFKMCANPIHM